jgi:hypothetical protein
VKETSTGVPAADAARAASIVWELEAIVSARKRCTCGKSAEQSFV